MTAGTAGRVAAVLFVVTAAAFVVGVTTEPDEHADESTEQGEAAHDEGAEEAVHESGEEEAVLGIDVESPGPIGAAVLVSAVVAFAVWFRPLRPVALAAVIIGVGFAVFDVAEVAQQLDESRTGFALLAAVVAAGHALAALLSGRVAWPRTSPPTPRREHP